MGLQKSADGSNPLKRSQLTGEANALTEYIGDWRKLKDPLFAMATTSTLRGALASRASMLRSVSSCSFVLEVDHANPPGGMTGLIALIQVCRVYETDAIAFYFACATMNMPKQVDLWLLAPNGIEQLGASEM